MNRRAFLRFFAGAAALVVAPLTIARASHLARLPVPETVEQLIVAMEALFPRLAHSVRAYEVIGEQRIVHTTYALQMHLPFEEIVDGKWPAEKTERLLVAPMWNTFTMLAERPENVGATLWWRSRPEINVDREFETAFENRTIRCRLALQPHGWRRTLAGGYRGPLAKAEGAPVARA